jgi:hypothetical protein
VLIPRTQSLPSDFSKLLEIDLVLCILEEIFFPGLTPNERRLECRSPFRDLINLILVHLSA